MPHEPQPLTQPRDYGTFNVAWGALVGGLLATTRSDGRDAPAAAELPVLGLATFALTKAVSKEKAGSWVRSRLLEPESDGRHPKGGGLRFVAGELLTCSRCLGAWTSVALIGLRVARPREGRIVASLLATSAINDALQAAFDLLCARANTAAARARVSEIEAQAADARRTRTEALSDSPR